MNFTGEGIKGEIIVDCRFMRGADVAKAFGYPEEWGEKSAVYVCGFVRHTAGCRAYVTLDIDAKPEFSSRVDGVKVNLVPPGMSAGTPFLVPLRHSVDKTKDVSKVKPSVHVVKVWYK